MDGKSSKIQQRPWLCIEPFTTIDFRVDQDKVKVTCCCNLDLSNINREYDFDFLAGVRQQMRDHIVPKDCHICHLGEAQGQQSERVRYLMSYTEEEIDRFSETFKANDLQIGMKFSNKCNLACRSCNQFDSSFYASKMGHVPIDSLVKDLSDDTIFWQTITNKIREGYNSGKNLIIHPIGGETLLQPGFYKLIDWLIDENLTKNTIIRLTTSLAVNLSNEFVDKLQKFNKITFLLSIDSVGDNYNCVRWPATFDRIERNLDILTDLRQRRTNKIEIAVTPVFSLNNIMYLVDYLDWWQKWATDREQDLWMFGIHLYHPKFLSIESVPAIYRSMIINVIDAARDHKIFKQHAKTAVMKDYLDTLIDTMKNLDTDPDFNSYLRFSGYYDKRTGSDISRLNSRLFDMLNAEHLEIYQKELDSNNIIPILPTGTQ